MGNDREYTVNNPTQNNYYGAEENSLQTAGRKVKEIYNNPQDALNTTVDVLDEVMQSMLNGFGLWLQTVAIPTLVCGFVFLWMFSTFYAHTTISHFLFGTNGLFAMLWMVTGMFTSIFLRPHVLPFTMFVGCAIVWYAWTTIAVMYRIFGKDKKRARKAVKLSLLASLYMIMSGKK